MRTIAMELALVVVVVALGLGLLAVFQRQFIYFPERHVPPAARVLPGAEVVRFETADGVTLNGWFVPGRSRTTTVVVFNGNAGNRAHRAPLAMALAREGLAVLLFDYRGYGDNPGTPNEEGLLADARAAASFAASHGGAEGRPVVYFGESLGAAVAVALAHERPPSALVLRSPFTSLHDVGRVHYPLVPLGLFLRDRYESLSMIPRVAAPLFVIAGEQDSVVPVEQSRRLFEAANEPKRFLLVPGADHNDLELLVGARVVEEVSAFLRELTP